MRSPVLSVALAVALPGCMGTLRTPDGADRVRGALWFEAPDAAPGLHAAVVLVTNSRLPCAAPEVEDDPDTPDDEAAAARIYWSGEVVSAFTREGAVVVAMVLYTRLSDWDGAYAVSADPQSGDAWSASRAASAAWYEVQEAELVGVDGLFYQYSPTLLQYDDPVDAPGDIEVAVDGETMEGTFSFLSSDVSGRFQADTCDNEALYNVAIRQFEEMATGTPPISGL